MIVISIAPYSNSEFFKHYLKIAICLFEKYGDVVLVHDPIYIITNSVREEGLRVPSIFRFKLLPDSLIIKVIFKVLGSPANTIYINSSVFFSNPKTAKRNLKLVLC